MSIEDHESVYATDSDVSDGEDEVPAQKGEETKQKTSENRLSIDIDLALSPWSNATGYYDQKRSAADKEQKTLQSSTQALKSQEAKIGQKLKEGLKQEKAVLRPVRRQMWFEKFTWFISSDGYLVLGGKDAQQNEILYKKYLKKGDVYLHADLHGATSVIIRNNPKTPDAPIPPSTLSQAGTLVVATSSAWDSKAGMSAWWVNADQVSKSDPTGEFLPTGSFMVRGKKNFLPPAQLVLGFGVMWQISEESKARHVKHRVFDDKPIDRLEEKALQFEEVDDNLSVDGEDNLSNAEVEERQAQNANPLRSSPGQDNVSDEEQQSPTRELQDFQISEAQNGHEDEGSIDSEQDSAHDSDYDPQAIIENTPSPSQPVKNGPVVQKRGKKGKAKKIATKYKDQDEEDRIAAQQLIGSTAGQEKAEAEAKAKSAREAEVVFQKERRRAQHQRTQKETAEHEEIRKAMLEEGLEPLDDDDEAEKMTSFDALVGTALPGDEILEAIPMCAPWPAMNKCKYKVKMQPGTTKKGESGERDSVSMDWESSCDDEICRPGE